MKSIIAIVVIIFMLLGVYMALMSGNSLLSELFELGQGIALGG
jgi:hypothetical protein